MQTAIDQIRALHVLHEDGLLSQEEFQQRRHALLDAIAASGPGAAPPNAGSNPGGNPGINPGTELGLMAGQLVGPPERRYRLERLVAPGGMGQVWQATDLATRTELGHSAQVAVKILAPEAEEGGQVRLLLQEATRARRLAHEHIVRVYDWAQDPATGSHFLIMEYLDGEDLGGLLAREGALPLDRVLALLEPVAAALDYAWDKHGLVHRDIKPANVFVTVQGEVKLLDFGIAARARGAGGGRGAHEAPGMSGTPGYRAPEAGAPDLVPARALDVYAVARMAAQMLSTQAPSSDGLDPPRPDQVGERLWEALRAGWAPAPADRPESVGALLARLRAAAGAIDAAEEERASGPAAPLEAAVPAPQAGEQEPAPAMAPEPEPAPALAPLPAPRLGAAPRHADDPERAARHVALRAQLAARRAAALDEARLERDDAERRALGAKAAAAYLAEQERMRAQAEVPAQVAQDRTGAPVAFWRDRFLDGQGAGPELVRIRAGRFQMGSPEHERRTALAAGTRAHWLARETPQRWVGIGRPFALGRYPVTVGEWRVFAETSGWRGGGTDSAAPGFPQVDAHPVVGVSWHDAQAYVRWLAERTGQRYRLPSEAEWEYACRAGTRGPFHFGDGIDTGRANYDGGFAWNGGPLGERRGGTTPVTLFAPNAWGLHDMHGNVWEWVQDVLHDSYEGAPLDGRAWEGGDGSGDEDGDDRAGRRRVLRGGCWRYHPRYLRSALRNGVAGTMANDIVGFRVARELGGEGGEGEEADHVKLPA